MADRTCYNRGCGKSYNPRENGDDACTYHPGAPYFHDAYKGWTCCEMKSTDFTTFLNTPGCGKGKHSNIKPVEPEKITGNLEKDSSPEEVIIRAPVQEAMKRPPIDTPLLRLNPTIAASLKQQKLVASSPSGYGQSPSENGVNIGESCKNNGCKTTYAGPDTNLADCTYHPGVPVFHEGMKFWSCCQRKTSEFQQFLDQEGCDIGKHKWVKEDTTGADIECRYDMHQTASHVTVAIYSKKYDPLISYVEVNPIKLRVHIYFPLEKGSFELETELRGIIDMNDCSCSMMGTKMEIKMKKAEIGLWTKLEAHKIATKESKVVEPEFSPENLQVDALDLDDVDFSTPKLQLSEDARAKVDQFHAKIVDSEPEDVDLDDL